MEDIFRTRLQGRIILDSSKIHWRIFLELGFKQSEGFLRDLFLGSYAFAEAKDPLKDCFRIIKDPFEGDLSESALGFVGGFKKGEGFLRDLFLGSYKFVEAKDP